MIFFYEIDEIILIKIIISFMRVRYYDNSRTTEPPCYSYGEKEKRYVPLNYFISFHYEHKLILLGM